MTNEGEQYMIIRTFFIFSLLYVFGGLVASHEVDLSTPRYQLSVCAVFKDEAPRLPEWIEYHQNLGVDHFYLYSVGSHDSFREALAPYLNKGLVTLVNWPEVASRSHNLPYVWALSTQVPAYENAVNIFAKEETKWLIFMDVDERLVCSEGSIKEYLNNCEDCSFVSLATHTFDGPVQITFEKKRLFDQATEYPLSDIEVLDTSVSKMFFKPKLCQGFEWPPYRCRFKEGHTSTRARPQALRIKRTLQRGIVKPMPKPAIIPESYGEIIECGQMFDQRPELFRKFQASLTENQ